MMTQFFYCLLLIFLFTQQYLLGKGQNDSFRNQTPTEVVTNITLKVLLVEFQDVKHRNPSYPSNLKLPAYTYDDFNNMLFSEDIYYFPNIYSPDSAKVFGSLRDYYNIMSNNHLDITGDILNVDLNKDNIPDWIVLDKSKEYYDRSNLGEFKAEAKSKATIEGLDISTDSETFLAIIYAGQTYRCYNKQSLIPQAFIEDHEYIMGERFASYAPYREERDDPSENRVSHFAHIGIHAHEFGHLLGFEDYYLGITNEFWGLMSYGCLNGPKSDGACPAPINPFLRWKMGWIENQLVKHDTTVTISYDIQNPRIFRLEYGTSGDFFLIEFRKFNLDCNLNNDLDLDYNLHIKDLNEDSGILVWRKLTGNYVKLLYSCGFNSDCGDHHIFPGKNNMKVLSPWSDNRNVDDGYYWVPNTKPSNNCGFEIIKIDKNHCTIDLYVENPLNASPSNPKKLHRETNNNIVEILWDEYREPDFDHYKIYKREEFSEYSIYDTSHSNRFIDFNEIWDTSSYNTRLVYYKITAIDSSNKESTFSQEIEISVINNLSNNTQHITKSVWEFSLEQNYPNPFNPNTTLKYSIPSEVKSEKSNVKYVMLKVYDVLGREVATLVNENQNPGYYEVQFYADKYPSGIYFYRLQTEEYSETMKMILIK